MIRRPVICALWLLRLLANGLAGSFPCLASADELGADLVLENEPAELSTSSPRLPDVERSSTPSGVAVSEKTSPIRLFLSCPQECFDTYLRQRLSHFDFSRDPHLADLVLVVVRQPAANGGERFSVTLSRRTHAARFVARARRSFVMPPGAPAHSVRQRLAQLLLQLLFVEVADSPEAEAFVLDLAPRDGTTLSALADPWDYWVFVPELRGAGEGASGYYFAELGAALTVRRVNDVSKLRVTKSYARDLSGYKLEDGRRVRGDVYRWDGRVLYAHSVGRHSAFGFVTAAKGSEYENTKLHVHGGAMAEINVFPYAENATRQVRFAYQLGPWANRYFERNTRGVMREVRGYHALSLVVDVNQPWGSVQWIGQVNEFLDAPELFRVSSGAILSLRLFAGFAVSLEGEAAYVRDLINLRMRPITDLELLLWTAQQPTKYQWGVQFALTYTFGSVHNTVVNPRFGRVDLEKE